MDHKQILGIFLPPNRSSQPTYTAAVSLGTWGGGGGGGAGLEGTTVAGLGVEAYPEDSND